MAKSDSTMKLGRLERTFELTRTSLDKERRTVKVQFASEEPVMRWFGSEILQCDSSSCDLSRMNAGAAVLIEHDVNQRCGITESGTMTPARVGEAQIRFSKNERGDAAMAEVEDGTLKWVSVGYRVNKFQVDDNEEQYRAISWQPLEVSFVAIPADPTARVLRSNNNNEHEVMLQRTMQLDKAATETGGGTIPAPAAPTIITKEDFSRHLDEAREIVALGAHWQRTHPQVGDLVDKSLKDKTPIVDFQRKLMEIIATPARQDLSAPAIGDGQAQRHLGPKSFGQRFVESPQYREMVGKRRFKGIDVSIPDEFQFRSDLSTRATFSASTEGIAGTSGANIDQKQAFNPLGQQPLFVADLFSQGATTGDVVRYIQESTFTNAATRVAEGGAKPGGTLDLGIVNATVEKTAVYQDVTEEMLADFSQASSFINSRLAYMVQALEDQQLLTGSGSSQIKGVLNFSGLQTLSGASNTIDAFLKAKSYVEGANGAGFTMADAFILNPLDWLSARLSKDLNGQYLFGGPGYAPYGVGGYANVGMMWGLPVVSTVSMTRGTALCGAFRMGGQIFRRAGLTLRTTDSDGSKFLSNILTIVAEQRMTLAVYQPNRFCSVTAIPTSF